MSKTIEARTRFVVAVGAMAALAATGLRLSTAVGQSAEPVLDQRSCEEAPVAYARIDAGTWKAQTFVAGVDGRLAFVRLPSIRFGSPGLTTLHLRPTDSCDGPLATDLAAAGARAGDRFDFADPPRLEAGRTYALVVSHEGAPRSQFGWGYSNRPDCYSNSVGSSYTSIDGLTWHGDIDDIHFETWMLADPPRPAGVAVQSAAPMVLEPGAGVAHDLSEFAVIQQGMSVPDPVSGSRGREAPPRPNGRAARPEAAVRKSVMVISLPTGRYDAAHIRSQTRAVIEQLQEASAYHGYADPLAQPYLAYDLYQDRIFVEEAMPPRCGGSRDLGSLFSKHGICDLVRAGEVDEVWFWEGGTGGIPEWATNGPEWQSLQGTRMPNCGRQVALMAFHNGLGPDYALHSFGHRLEWTMRTYRPCDFTTVTWPWPAVPAGCLDGSASDRTGFVARPFAGNGFVGACGDVHTPPNVLQDVGYQYGRTDAADSICEDWRRDGKSRSRPLSCARWGCSQLGFMRWWLQNVPGIANQSADIDGKPMENWWPLLFGRSAGGSPGTPRPTPSPRPPPPTIPPPTGPTPTVPSPTRPPNPPLAAAYLPLLGRSMWRADLDGQGLPPAAYVAYRVPAGTVGGQVHLGALGMDFDVVRPVLVTALGAFDSGQDGLRAPIHIYLVDREGDRPLAAVELYQDASPLKEGSRLAPLDPPLTLAAGFQGSVVADGYNADEPNGNAEGRPAPWTVDGGQGALRFVGGGRYANVWTYGRLPGILDDGPANRYAAGTFAYQEIGPPLR